MVANNSIEYTMRCPDCLRDLQTFDILMNVHDGCIDMPKKGKQALLVLVGIGGEDVSRDKDPKLPERPKMILKK